MTATITGDAWDMRAEGIANIQDALGVNATAYLPDLYEWFCKLEETRSPVEIKSFLARSAR